MYFTLQSRFVSLTYCIEFDAYCVLVGLSIHFLCAPPPLSIHNGNNQKVIPQSRVYGRCVLRIVASFRFFLFFFSLFHFIFLPIICCCNSMVAFASWMLFIASVFHCYTIHWSCVPRYPCRQPIHQQNLTMCSRW